MERERGRAGGREGDKDRYSDAEFPP